MGAVVGLWVLATWCAEVAWGGFTVADYPVVLVFLGPLYGGAALLIREVARRAGAGWPGIVLLAAAFGLVQAGLVDQSLFDRAALDGTGFAGWGEQARATLVPGLGFSAEQLFGFVGGHVWLSMCAPIALVEACVRPQRRGVPWLGWPGLVVTAGLYLAGSLLIWSDSGRAVGGVQAGFVVVVAGVLVVVAVRPRRSVRRVSGVGPWAVGALVLAGHVVVLFLGSSWWAVAGRLVTLVVVAWLAVRWVASPRHVVAAWGAGVVAAVGTAFLAPPYAPAEAWLMVVSDVVGAVVAGVVLVVAWWRAGLGEGARHAGPVRRG